jgi:hypothetical protein
MTDTVVTSRVHPPSTKVECSMARTARAELFDPYAMLSQWILAPDVLPHQSNEFRQGLLVGSDVPSFAPTPVDRNPWTIACSQLLVSRTAHSSTFLSPSASAGHLPLCMLPQ